MAQSSRFKQALLALPLTIAAGQALAVESANLRLAHNLDTSHVVHRAFAHMAEELEKLSDGAMTVRIFPNSQMGSQRETTELMQNGALDMTKGSGSALEPFADVYSVFNLPYLFNDQAHFNEVVYGEIGDEIMASTEDKGFVAIGAYVAGNRSFYADKPIESPADLQGMKIRVQDSPTTIRMMELLGASATPIPFGEVYTALQQGVVDGAENNVPSYVQTRHLEQAGYFSEDEHTSVPDFLLISTSTLASLDEEQTELLMQAVASSEAYQQKLWDEVDAEARSQAVEMGATFVEVDKTPFQEAVAPMLDDFRANTQHGGLLDRILTAGE
ncbi:TRAP transporter substrate-binding protein [Halomonas sp. H10-9-1]|uniref:TRAP transporter substrate-binding protein n=1 Tax=Halomonas sp. H10-9-1 TaxID=2950871 RepID=UPI0032DFEDEA